MGMLQVPCKIKFTSRKALWDKLEDALSNYTAMFFVKKRKEKSYFRSISLKEFQNLISTIELKQTVRKIVEFEKSKLVKSELSYKHLLR